MPHSGVGHAPPRNTPSPTPEITPRARTLAFTETAAALGLTQKQACALWLIADHAGISQIDLGQRLQMDRATTMGVINRLQARGLVRREKSASDGRKQALHLEPAGEVTLAATRQAMRDHEAWLASRFTKAEHDTLADLLARLHQ